MPQTFPMKEVGIELLTFFYMYMYPLIMVAHNCHGKTKNLTAKTKYLTAKPKTSQQKQKPHGKTKNSPRGRRLKRKRKGIWARTKAKAKTSRQQQNTSWQDQKPHRKTKDLTAKPNTSQQKPNTSRQKQIPTSKPKLFCFCCEVFGFAVRFLVLPWGILLFYPWGFGFCCEVFGFAMTDVGHHT